MNRTVDRLKSLCEENSTSRWVLDIDDEEYIINDAEDFSRVQKSEFYKQGFVLKMRPMFQDMGNITSVPCDVFDGELICRRLDNLEHLFDSMDIADDFLIHLCPKLKELPKELSCNALEVVECPSIEKVVSKINARSCHFDDCSSLVSIDGDITCERLDIYACYNLKRIGSDVKFDWLRIGENVLRNLEEIPMLNVPVHVFPKNIEFGSVIEACMECAPHLIEIISDEGLFDD